MPSPEIQPFFSWFQSHNGYIDTAAMDVIQFPASEGGRGAVALKDIPEGHAVFSIPRSLVLSTRTSKLPSKFGIDAWRAFGLHKGWSGLILCMMWEAALGSSSKWSVYFDVLPSTFDTPMFWNDADLAELQGTCVVEKLGRDQAEKDYNEKVLPAVTSRPDLFAKNDIPTRYSLETYHLMGSRILSRSFTIEKDGDGDEHAKETAPEEDAGNTSITSVGSTMDVDEPVGAETHEDHAGHDHDHGHGHGDEDGEEGEDEDDEEEVAAEVVMIPLADILNARYESENVKLFYEPDCLKMVATKPIKAGDQIWNTYGDLPNAELLRSYGHVDYLPLPGGGFGNPGDVAELRADLLVHALGAADVNTEAMEERIDWWLEEGGDDVFVLEGTAAEAEAGLEIPPEVLAFTRLLVSDAEWDRAKAKGKPPKPKSDVETLKVVHEALRRKLAAYATSLEEDTRVAETALDTLSLNKRHALIVRLGEKRVLEAFRAKAAEMLRDMEAEEQKAKAKTPAGNGGKRKAEKGEKGGSGEGRKRRK